MLVKRKIHLAFLTPGRENEVILVLIDRKNKEQLSRSYAKQQQNLLEVR